MIEDPDQRRALVASLPHAYSFKCHLDRLTLRAKLQEVGCLNWDGVDSDNYGLYSRGTPVDESWPARLFIYGEEPPDYLLEIGYHFYELYEGADPYPLISFIKEQLLPAIGAQDIKQTEGIR